MFHSIVFILVSVVFVPRGGAQNANGTVTLDGIQVRVDLKKKKFLRENAYTNLLS